MSGRRADRGESIVRRIADSGGRAAFHQADLSDATACAPLCKRAADEFGGLDILVNNAGIFPVIEFEETTIEQWDRVFDLNARAAFFCAQAAVPMMRVRGGGSIVNIGSTHPFIAGAGQFVYGISKGALHTMTRKLAMLLAPDKIRANWISVGWVLTEEERRLRNVPDDDAAWIAEYQERNPMREFTSVDDVAEATLYLCADSGRRVTGTDLGVSSG
ncbi:MAG: SDR family oxidoreductase, partial [Spirochaetaceae bacterium]